MKANFLIFAVGFLLLTLKRPESRVYRRAPRRDSSPAQFTTSTPTASQTYGLRVVPLCRPSHWCESSRAAPGQDICRVATIDIDETTVV
jgi:hypothetical protein